MLFFGATRTTVYVTPAFRPSVGRKLSGFSQKSPSWGSGLDPQDGICSLHNALHSFNNKERALKLINLQVHDVILHEVFKRGNDQVIVPPQYGIQTEALDVEALDALRDRIVTAMTSSTRCVEMAITNVGAESMATRVSELVDADEALYIATSKTVADKLTYEQKSRAIPGGVLVVFRGTAGAPARRIVGFIKAEVHNGFTREIADGHASLKFLTSLMLTAQTKLYKVGLFIEREAAAELADVWQAFIYDEMLTVRNRYEAAKYFYDGFLGLGFPESSARQTKQFHELTKGFIQAMNAPEEDKVVLHNALVTYLKADQQPTVGIASFAETYFGEPEVQEAYRGHMLSNGFPENPVNKDTSDVDGVLRFRRISFNKIKVTGPAQDFERLVRIDSIEGDIGANGVAQQWTRVTIKDRISGQD